MYELARKPNQQGMEERKYKIVRKIGQGTFGKVYEAEDNKSTKVAIKRVEKVANAVSREVDILKMINHKHCIKLLDVFYTSEDGGVENKFQNLVFDYHPQTLYRYIQDKSCCPKSTKILFYQLCLAIHHIHEKNICHRDITPSNILLSSEGHVVLADFGSAKMLESEHISMSYVCSRYYRAPELLLGCSNYSTKVDIWSAGCILAEMLMGRPIFPGNDNQDQLIKIVLILGAPSLADLWAMKKNYKQILRFPQIDPLYFGSLLPKTLTEPDIVADLLYGMLCYNPKSRLSIENVLKHPFFNDIKSLLPGKNYLYS
jgi:glycogen synthase kinase 3 beta